MRILRDKSLIEDYNGTIQLQPIIRRFAEYQFLKRPKEVRQKYCLDAYKFNSYILEIIEIISKKETRSEALKLYNFYKNNLINVLTYIPDIEIDNKEPLSMKKFFINYIYDLNNFIVNDKQINYFLDKLNLLTDFFADLPNTEILIKVILYNKAYYYHEFDESYQNLAQIFSVQEMEERVFSDEEFSEKRYKNIISNVHSMEGYTFRRIKAYVLNNIISPYLSNHFFYLGILNNIKRHKKEFYFFEYELILQRLNITDLEEYINGIYPDEHLEKMQCVYTLSKVKKVDYKVIQKLVITNPYTKGLKELMFAFIVENEGDKKKHFEAALHNLSHIKYYYLECLYYYCIFLRTTNYVEYLIKVKEGKDLSSNFFYQYINHLFDNIENEGENKFNFNYSYYPLDGLEAYVIKHNSEWESIFKKLY